MKTINRASKYLIYVCAVLILFNVFLGLLLTRQSSKAMRSLINGHMLDLSNTAAAMIDGDQLEKLSAEDLNSPEYQYVLKMLTYFQENIELEYIYCIKDMGNKEFVFSVDPTEEDPGEFGEPIVYTDALYQASLGIPSVDDTPYEDKWGRFYSAYTPVFDSQNEVAGIVAVDFSVDWYETQIKKQMKITALVITAAALFSIVIAAIIAKQYHDSMSHVFLEMNDLSDGIETLIQEVTPEGLHEEKEEVPKEEPPQEFQLGGFKDEVTILGDKIRTMHDRLSEQIDVVRSRAYIDGLTGLNNRSAYEDFIANLDKRIFESHKVYFSVVVFDINQLKIINDDYGHEEGDHVIIQVAEAVRKVFEGERIYRIGGDEFVSIVYGVDPKGRIEDLRKELKEINDNDTLLKENSLEIAVSIGYAVYDRDIDIDYAEVFARADNAMYADKRAFYQTHEDRRKRK